MGARGVAWGAVVLVALAGGAVAADRWALAETERRVAGSVRSGVDELQGSPEVTIAGFPYLTQLAAGTLDTLTVTVEGATVGDVTLRGVEVHARDVGTEQPHPAASARLTATAATLDGVDLQDVTVRADGVTTGEPLRARTARLSGTLTTASAERLVGERTELDDARLAVDGDVVTATARVLGVAVSAELDLHADGRAIAVDVVRARVGDLVVDAEDLPRRVRDRLSDLSLPVDGLPEGVTLTDVTVVDEGLRITAAGESVSLATTG